MLLFADFAGSKVEELRELRQTLRAAGAKFQVLKKRLLKLAFQKGGMDFDPLQFKAQLGTVFLPRDLSDFAAQIYKFSKELERAKTNLASRLVAVS